MTELSIVPAGAGAGKTHHIQETLTQWVRDGKVRPENMVSFCWDGDVKKTSPTTFEMDATDFFPPYNRELEILILNRNDPDPNVG